MLHLDPAGLAIAFGAGIMHGLTPCGHSWPVLIPVMGRGPALRPAAWYGSGLILAGVATGIAIGAGGAAIRSVFSGGAGETVENVFGVLFVVFGLAILLRTKLSHVGHVHGDCLPQGASDPASCGHEGHGAEGATRVARRGRSFGAFLLGAASVTVPCFSNITAVGISIETGDLVGGAVTYGVYSLAAALVTYAILEAVRRGYGVLAKLSSPAFESKIILASGVALILYGVVVLLHLGHHHHH